MFWMEKMHLQGSGKKQETAFFFRGICFYPSNTKPVEIPMKYILDHTGHLHDRTEVAMFALIILLATGAYYIMLSRERV